MGKCPVWPGRGGRSVGEVRRCVLSMRRVCGYGLGISHELEARGRIEPERTGLMGAGGGRREALAAEKK